MTQKPGLEVFQFPCRSDNYGLLVFDPVSRKAISIDSPEEMPIIGALESQNLELTHILNTHHHYDHVEANKSLKARFGCQIVGAAADRERIPGMDKGVKEGDVIGFCGHDIHILETSGHTLGHISYWIPDSNLLFTGDTLFSMGCGRLFEGNAEMMWQSLQKIRALPQKTQVYCAHEYTLSNGEFALEIEPGNQALQSRMEQVRELRRNRLPTLPVSLQLELETNPFLRLDSAEIQKNIAMEGAALSEVFSRIRQLKDRF